MQSSRGQAPASWLLLPALDFPVAAEAGENAGLACEAVGCGRAGGGHCLLLAPSPAVCVVPHSEMQQPQTRGYRWPVGQLVTSARQEPDILPRFPTVRCSSTRGLSDEVSGTEQLSAPVMKQANSLMPLTVSALPPSPPRFVCPRSCLPRTALAKKVLVHQLWLQTLFSRKSWLRNKPLCLVVVGNCSLSPRLIFTVYLAWVCSSKSFCMLRIPGKFCVL